MRMVDCEYCELQFKAMDLYQHQDSCGSRTDVCEKCQQYVMLKEMKSHLENMCISVVQPDGRGSHPTNVGEANNNNGGGATGYGSETVEYGATGFSRTAAYGGGAMEPELDQSWVNAIAACNDDGRSLSSILAENLAGSERQWPPVHNPSFGIYYVCSVYMHARVCVCVCVCAMVDLEIFKGGFPLLKAEIRSQKL